MLYRDVGKYERVKYFEIYLKMLMPVIVVLGYQFHPLWKLQVVPAKIFGPGSFIKHYITPSFYKLLKWHCRLQKVLNLCIIFTKNVPKMSNISLTKCSSKFLFKLTKLLRQPQNTLTHSLKETIPWIRLGRLCASLKIPLCLVS